MAWWQLWKPSWERNLEDISGPGEVTPFSEDDVNEAYGHGRPNGTVRAATPIPKTQEIALEPASTASQSMAEDMPTWIIDLCTQAMKEVEIEENFVGTLSDEERRRKQWAVCTRLLEERRIREARADAIEYESDAQSELMEKLTEVTDQLNWIAAASENTPTNFALRFQREHPFLAGWIGADLAIRARKK